MASKRADRRLDKARRQTPTRSQFAAHNYDLRHRVAELEAALRELAGDQFWLERMSSMHDVGAMEDVVRAFAKETLADPFDEGKFDREMDGRERAEVEDKHR